MIPKIIHYCWFGGNPLPDDAIKCIESWKKFCPDYIIKEWNENNFDINSNEYVRQAYESKKWAFVTDYVRLYALVNEGGIYMDTDVEVIKNLDEFLKHKAFSGFETKAYVPTGIMACEKGFKLFRDFLDYYTDKQFIDENGNMDLTTNVITITNICIDNGLVCDGNKQSINGFELYPTDYFCPKDHDTGVITVTDNTHTIHHFSGSWIDSKDQRRIYMSRKICRCFGNTFGNSFFAKLVVNIYAYGIVETVSKIMKKLHENKV